MAFIFLQFFSLEEDDDCNLPTGPKGKCINIRDCAYAKKLLESKQSPENCGFEKKDPLVCCIEISSKLSRKPGELSAESKSFYLN